MTDSPSDVGTGRGEIIFSPIARLIDGNAYLGPVLVMLVNRDVRINGLIAWATSAKDGPLSAIVLLTTPETEPYIMFLEDVLRDALAPENIFCRQLTIPGTYDTNEAKYNYLVELFDGFLSGVRDRIIVDLTTTLGTIAQYLHAAASKAGVERYQKFELHRDLINVPPYNGLSEGVDYSIQNIPKTVQSPRFSQKISNERITDMILILFLAADPTDASRLRLGEELREIQEKLQLAKLREKFQLHQRMSVRPTDISQALLDLEPRVVHFSGHGMSSGALCFEDITGKSHPIQPEALAALFEQFANQVNCVLLNACYSENQAIAIATHIEYVIGMNQAIGDEAAIAFAVGFYQALGAGRSIEAAYKLGCVQIRLHDLPEHLTPVLIRKGE